MGHRALVAYERSSGRYDLHYSHWGAQLDLSRLISPETPFGRGTDDSPPVDPDPLAIDLPFGGVLDRVDFLQHEAVFVVSPAYEVSEYRVLWFGVLTGEGVLEGDGTVGRGALIEVSPHDPGRGYARGWFDGVRHVAGELVDRGVLGEEDVVGYLEDHLRRFAGVGRTLLFDPAVNVEDD